MKPCGGPSITTGVLPSIVSCGRLPLTSNGTIASESPWMTGVGTVTLAGSSRESVRPNAVMQSIANVPR